MQVKGFVLHTPGAGGPEIVKFVPLRRGTGANKVVVTQKKFVPETASGVRFPMLKTGLETIVLDANARVS